MRAQPALRCRWPLSGCCDAARRANARPGPATTASRRSCPTPCGKTTVQPRGGRDEAECAARGFRGTCPRNAAARRLPTPSMRRRRVCAHAVAIRRRTVGGACGTRTERVAQARLPERAPLGPAAPGPAQPRSARIESAGTTKRSAPGQAMPIGSYGSGPVGRALYWSGRVDRTAWVRRRSRRSRTAPAPPATPAGCARPGSSHRATQAPRPRPRRGPARSAPARPPRIR